MTVTIWHNPACGTSRNALAMIRAVGIEPVVVVYPAMPPSRDALARIAAEVGGVRRLLRVKGTPAAALGLDRPGVGDAAILEAMLAQPILIERPVVIAPTGTIVARPSERVLGVLDAPLTGDFTKEDGEIVRAPRA